MDAPKKVGHRFGPGNCANPNGRPKMTEPKLSDYSKNLTKVAVTRMLSEILDCSVKELKSIVEDPSTPALKVAVASVVRSCIQHGDYARLEMLLNRTIGKVKDEALIETKNHDDALEKVPRQKIVELLRTVNE